jgi:phosphate transport system substrate-binding protein
MMYLLYGCENNRHSQTYKVDLFGVGNTFQQPFCDIVLSNYYLETRNRVFCNEVGNGDGSRAFQDKLVDFIFTNLFLNDDELIEYESEVLHIPIALGAVVMAFNIPDVTKLNLNSDIITGIYSGIINYWDDASIRAINADVKLPHLLITPVFRSDESETTYLFSNYLQDTCPEWKKKFGKGKSIRSSLGIAVKGNPAVANTIKNEEGSIGYVDMEHASSLDLPMAAIKNASGNYIEANSESLLYAAETELPDDMRTILTNPKQEDAYPIPCLSWILVYKNQAYNNRSIEKYESLKAFLNYLISPKAQIIADRLTAYSPLPVTVIEKAQQLVNLMNYELKIEN